MSTSIKNFKEILLECKSEDEALQLMKSYQKENFHFVNKKCIDPQTNETVVKLIRFQNYSGQNYSGQNSLISAWDEWVHQMLHCRTFRC